MFARAWSGTVFGVEAQEVIVEAHQAKGLPGLSMVGLARGAVKESLIRVRSAIAASGYRLPGVRLVVNLRPAELPKDASALDLSLALALLAATGELEPEHLEGRRFFGELSLGGELIAVSGSILLADLSRAHRDRELIVASENGDEAAIIPDVQVRSARHLSEVIAYLQGTAELTTHHTQTESPNPNLAVGCMTDIRGQSIAKRALTIAAAGGHNILMLGPPGSGKTMLARRLPAILPALSAKERIEVTRIHSAASVLNRQGLIQQRPFRSPHHTSSDVALCGGGSFPKPGEVTLAHRGVLFLDELPEFSRRSLESMREPLEDQKIRISRAQASIEFPASFMLVAAMNPCPCGYFHANPDSGEPPSARTCLCSIQRIQRYIQKISGPLLDRIDLHVSVEALRPQRLLAPPSGQDSKTLRTIVEDARAKQHRRLGGDRNNAQMSSAEVQHTIQKAPHLAKAMEKAMTQLGLSARAITRCVKVARSIADLAQQDDIGVEHFQEAISFRTVYIERLNGLENMRLPKHPSAEHSNHQINQRQASHEYS